VLSADILKTFFAYFYEIEEPYPPRNLKACVDLYKHFLPLPLPLPLNLRWNLYTRPFSFCPLFHLLIWLPGLFSCPKFDHALNVSTHFHTVPGVGMDGAITLLPFTLSCKNRNNFAYWENVIRATAIYS